MLFMNARFNDRIDRARLFAKTAINTLEQVDVIACCTSCTIITNVGFDRNRQRRANRLAQLARDAAFLTVRITAQCM